MRRMRTSSDVVHDARRELDARREVEGNLTANESGRPGSKPDRPRFTSVRLGQGTQTTDTPLLVFERVPHGPRLLRYQTW
jgi:hypothetical protein